MFVLITTLVIGNFNKDVVIQPIMIIDYRLDYDWIFWVVNFKTRNYFVIFYYTERLPQVIYVRLL
jgi:hypothetical protein